MSTKASGLAWGATPWRRVVRPSVTLVCPLRAAVLVGLAVLTRFVVCVGGSGAAPGLAELGRQGALVVLHVRTRGGQLAIDWPC